MTQSCAEPGRPGALFAIGGAEDKVRRRTVLTAFVKACGGEDARIAVVSSASSLGPEVVDVYTALFRRLGARSVVSARPQTRDEAGQPAYTELLAGVTGIFLTGGNQLRLSAIVNGTPFGAAIRTAHAAGVVVGGTSAGASVLSTHMVAFGAGGSTPKQRMTQLASGLGLLPGCVVDQHFEQRNRYGRLLMCVAQSPDLLGVGIDEDTAAVISGDRLDVVGRGSVTVVDGSELMSNAHEAPRTSPLLVSGARVHVLPAGAAFDLAERQLLAVPSTMDGTTAAELHEAEDELRQLARQIASGSPAQRLGRAARRRTTRLVSDSGDGGTRDSGPTGAEEPR